MPIVPRGGTTLTGILVGNVTGTGARTGGDTGVGAWTGGDTGVGARLRMIFRLTDTAAPSRPRALPPEKGRA
jgi:hypothetical protein